MNDADARREPAYEINEAGSGGYGRDFGFFFGFGRAAGRSREPS
jgi:hypothetical protein